MEEMKYSIKVDSYKGKLILNYEAIFFCGVFTAIEEPIQDPVKKSC